LRGSRGVGRQWESRIGRDAADRSGSEVDGMRWAKAE
jgi:hypothetical protein